MSMRSVCLGFGLLGVLGGCADPEAVPSSDSAVPEDAASAWRSYSGPGSYWTVDFDDDAGTFHIEVSENVGEPVAIEIDGTFAVTDGWTTLTVAAATDVEGAPAVGETAIGVEIPGFAFLLRPVDSGYNSVIPMLVQGDCPTGDETLNWMVAQGLGGVDATSTSADLFGSYQYGFSDHSATVTSRYALAGTTLNTEPAHSIYPDPCDGGVMTLHTDYTIAAELPAINLWMVPGGAMVETFEPNQTTGDIEKKTIFGLHAAEISSTDLSNVEFVGLHVSAPSPEEVAENTGSDAAIGDIVEVVVAFDGDGTTGTGEVVVDVTTDARADFTSTLSVTAFNTPSDGFFTGVLSTPEGGAGEVACAVATGLGTSSQTVLSCVGQNPGDNTAPFTLTMASR